MNPPDEGEFRRIYHRGELWPGDRLELDFCHRWVPAWFDAEERVIVFEVDPRFIGLADVDQAIEWGLRPIVH
jgi:hypothetical protein